MSKPAEKTGAEPAARPLSVLHGRVSGDWYYEENAGTTRFGIRVTEKLHEERSAFQKLVVYETAFFGRVLTLDDVVMLTERDERIRLWRELDHPQRPAFPGDPRDWERQHAEVAALTPC